MASLFYGTAFRADFADGLVDGTLNLIRIGTGVALPDILMVR